MGGQAEWKKGNGGVVETLVRAGWGLGGPFEAECRLGRVEVAAEMDGSGKEREIAGYVEGTSGRGGRECRVQYSFCVGGEGDGKGRER